MEELKFFDELVNDFIEYKSALHFAWPDEDETVTIELRIEIELEDADDFGSEN